LQYYILLEIFHAHEISLCQHSYCSCVQIPVFILYAVYKIWLRYPKPRLRSAVLAVKTARCPHITTPSATAGARSATERAAALARNFSEKHGRPNVLRGRDLALAIVVRPHPLHQRATHCTS
jgi:hypothetical protein